jgi:hypothetical protein
VKEGVKSKEPAAINTCILESLPSESEPDQSLQGVPLHIYTGVLPTHETPARAGGNHVYKGRLA